MESSCADVTSKHTERLILAIKKCFDNYSIASNKFRDSVEFNPLAVMETKNTKFPIDKVICLSYADVFNGTLLDMGNYIITKYQEGNCLLNNKTGMVENSYYGFSD